MDENEGRPIDRDAEPPWEGFRRWYRWLRRRLSLKPRDLTPADRVPPGAQPICPECVLPHHPAAARCPNCGEIVSRYATSMAYVWILVWGLKLQRVVRQERLSRLLWAGLVVSAVKIVADLLFSWGMVLCAPAEGPQVGWAMQALSLLHWALLVAIYLGAAFQMFEAAVQKWGTWREETAGEPTGD